MTLEASISNTLNIYCDGGSRGNPGPAAIGFLVKNNEGKVIHRHAQKIGESTNNIAEYQAVIAALTWIAKPKTNFTKPKFCNFYIDSRLVVNQLNGKFKIKNTKLKSLAIKVRKLEAKSGLALKTGPELFSTNRSIVSYNLIPRAQNSEADALLNEALDAI
jgi:ribonuclease HI